MAANIDDSAALANWIALAQNGDRSAFEFLIENTQSKLFKFCFVLSANRAQADDLLQETYLRALVKIHKLREPNQFMAWLFRIAKNVYLDQWRSRKLQGQAMNKIADLADSSRDEEATHTVAVRQALSQFDPKDRYLLSLIDLAEFTYAEAADIFGESEAAVKSRVFRLRKSFLKKLTGE